jgi:2',3'-cyclic-nucleotide 2'-phosphodiesterase (5'-nucleotidase family)
VVSGALIFHTADLHNRLSPAAARRLAGWKREHPGALLLDAGDAISAGNLTYRLRGEPMLRLMGEIGYDAMAMGNRESHPKRGLLMRKLRGAAFPVLAANLVARRGEAPSPIRDHIIFAGPPRVAVMGLAPQMTRPGSRWAGVVDFVFEEAVSAAAELAPRLTKEADLVICLSHAGLRADRELAAIPEVDLVLGGHSHRKVIAQEAGNAMVVHPGWHGSHVSRTEIWGRDRVRSELMALESGDEAAQR